MRKLTLIAIVIAFLASCERPPSATDLASKYTAAPDAFEKLGQLIRADTGKNKCFVVGLDNIGQYWEYSGEWTHINDYKNKLPLSSVLKAVGLSESRYGEYKQLFALTGSERVNFCQTDKTGPWVSVLVYRAGLAVSGCSGSINWQKEPPVATGKRGEGSFAEIILLRNGWYLEHECT